MAFLTDQPIDPAPLLHALSRPSDGGLALFVGVVRNENDGHAVTRLDYEAYGPMAEKEMARIADELARRHPEARILMRHRVGSLAIGDVAVVVAVSAPHREEAFAACREGIERIKARVPIWKRETGPSGSFWVEPCRAGEIHESD
ncbi:MAG: molybdenum cofactor biosynthesis protein MoaE [Acidithiobacillales bacterium]